MIDVHLIGYTADLRHIVLDFDPDHPRGRYRLEIDLDLFLTLDEVRELRRAAGLEAGPCLAVDELEESSTPSVVEFSNAEHDATGGGRAGDRRSPGGGLHGQDDVPGDDDVRGAAAGGREVQTVPPEVVVSVDRHDQLVPGATGDSGRLTGLELEALPPDEEPDEVFSGADWESSELSPQRSWASQDRCPTLGEAGDPETPPHPESSLTPAEIQALLRAGRSAKTVAKLAGINVRRVERWLQPILAERAQVLQEAHAIPLGSPSGRSRQTLSAAVKRNLSMRGTDPDQASWSVNRRTDGRWTVQLRYRDGNRSRCASWSFDRREQTLSAGSSLAQELGWSDEPGDRMEDEPAPASHHGQDARVDHEVGNDLEPDPVQEGEIV